MATLHSALQMISSGISTSTQSTPLSKSSLASISQSKLSTSHLTTSQKTKGKQMHQDAFMDKNKAEGAVLTSITADKHACKMAEHAQCMAELGIKKQQMDIEANRKHLEAEDCQIATQHQYVSMRKNNMICRCSASACSIREALASLDVPPLLPNLAQVQKVW